MLETHMFPCLNDNYGFLIHETESDLTACIDTPDVDAIRMELSKKKWRLTHILNTHHHWDHAGGNLDLKSHTDCTIVGPRADADRIPGIDISLADGDTFEFGNYRAQIYDTPGHTRGHIVYHFESEHIAFVGDTLFALGCGRIFEGSAEQMWNSLQKLMQWPNNTKIYCAHEYTQANARFALTVEPQNNDLLQRSKEIDQLRASNIPTIPTTLELEKKTNPFLRPMSKHLQETIGMLNKSEIEVFAKTRSLKDKFNANKNPISWLKSFLP